MDQSNVKLLHTKKIKARQLSEKLTEKSFHPQTHHRILDVPET